MVIEQQGEEVDAFKVNQWDKRETVALFLLAKRGAQLSIEAGCHGLLPNGFLESSSDVKEPKRP